MGTDNVGYFLHESRGVNGAAGIGWIAEYDQLGLVRDGLCELLRIYKEVIVYGRLQNNGSRTSQGHHLGVGRPVGRRNDDLVARAAHCQDSLVHRLLGAVANQDLIGLVRQFLALDKVGSNGGPQGLRASHGGVLGVPAPDGVHRCVENGGRRREVRLPDAEGSHLLALRLHGLDRREHLHRLGYFHSGDQRVGLDLRVGHQRPENPRSSKPRHRNVQA